MGGKGYAEQKAHYIKTWGLLCGLLLVSIVGPEIGAVTGIAVITLVTAFGVAGYKAWIVIKQRHWLGPVSPPSPHVSE